MLLHPAVDGAETASAPAFADCLATPASPAAIAAALHASIYAEAAEVDIDEGFPCAAMAALRENGLLAAPVLPEHGGAGLVRPGRLFELLQLLAHLGRGSLPVGRLYEGHVNALLLIHACASPAQIRRCAADAVAGELFAVWNTEGPDGVVLRDHGRSRFTLHGSKTFASGAGHVTRALITAADASGGRQMVLVPTDVSWPAIDRTFWRPLGMRATASYKVDFSGIEVTADAFIGQPGDYLREPMLGSGAARFAAVQLGGIEQILDETRRHLREVGHAGDPHQRARLGEMAMLAASGRQWLQGAAQHAALQGGEPQGNATHPGLAHTHLMRAAIEDIGLRVMRLAERSVGARGLLRPSALERLHRDLTHYLRQAGTDATIVAAGAHVLERREAAYALWND